MFPYQSPIKLANKDITELKVEAIVNAANSSLLGGGGVDGAIHRAAGPQLKEACKSLNGCPPGDAKVTEGFDLEAKYIIHTVGPVWNGGKYNEEEVLRNCYKNSLSLTRPYEISSIAIPNISTGVYHFPKYAAAEIAIEESLLFLNDEHHLEQLIFCCYDEENYKIYEEILTTNGLL